MSDAHRHDADHRFTLRIPQAVHKDLQKVAKAEANTTSAVVRRLLLKGLRDGERERQAAERASDK